MCQCVGRIDKFASMCLCQRVFGSLIIILGVTVILRTELAAQKAIMRPVEQLQTSLIQVHAWCSRGSKNTLRSFTGRRDLRCRQRYLESLLSMDDLTTSKVPYMSIVQAPQAVDYGCGLLSAQAKYLQWGQRSFQLVR